MTPKMLKIFAVNFLIMVISGVALLVTHANIFGIIFTATVLIGLVFATIDTETRQLASEEVENEVPE